MVHMDRRALKIGLAAAIGLGSLGLFTTTALADSDWQQQHGGHDGGHSDNQDRHDNGQGRQPQHQTQQTPQQHQRQADEQRHQYDQQRQQQAQQQRQQQQQHQRQADEQRHQYDQQRQRQAQQQQAQLQHQRQADEQRRQQAQQYQQQYARQQPHAQQQYSRQYSYQQQNAWHGDSHHDSSSYRQAQVHSYSYHDTHRDDRDWHDDPDWQRWHAHYYVSAPRYRWDNDRWSRPWFDYDRDTYIAVYAPRYVVPYGAYEEYGQGYYGPVGCNRDVVGAVIGGVAGGLIGAHNGGGGATVGGAIIGALLGGVLGQAIDMSDQACYGQVLEYVPNNQPVYWEDDGAQYQVTPLRTYQTGSGEYCREYRTYVYIDGREQQAYGTACRQPDGSWQAAN